MGYPLHVQVNILIVSFNFLNSSNYLRTVRIKRSGQLKRNANYFQLTGFSRDLWKRSKNSLPDNICKNMKIFTLQPGYFFSRFASQFLASKCLKRLKMRRKFSGSNRIRGQKVQIFGIFDAIWVRNYITRKQSLFEPKTSIRPDYFWAEKPYVNQNSYLSQELLSV